MGYDSDAQGSVKKPKKTQKKTPKTQNPKKMSWTLKLCDYWFVIPHTQAIGNVSTTSNEIAPRVLHVKWMHFLPSDLNHGSSRLKKRGADPC